MEVANKEIRDLIAQKGIPYWQVASACGISNSTFSVWLRFEFSEERKAMVIEAINSIEV